MIKHVTLAIDSATDRLTVAIAHGDVVQSLHVDGPRRHAREALGMVDALLTERGLAPREITRVISGDGPGSFTGLRVASAVAKALVWGRSTVEWWTAPSLLVRAVEHADPVAATTVLSLSDALRGELYAGCWRFEAGGITLCGGAPHAMRPEALDAFGAVDVVVGTVPEAMLAMVAQATGRQPIVGEATLPDARWLVALADWQGGLVRVSEPVSWHPQYGRPAEAQAVWEAKHGRRLPDSTHHAG
jgi:tRNA threonylcarbamoyladenosine biosynthesis protein TsaB